MDILKKLEDVIREYKLPEVLEWEDKIFYMAKNNLKKVRFEIYGLIYYAGRRHAERFYVGILNITIWRGKTKTGNVIYIQESSSLENLRGFVKGILLRYNIDYEISEH